MLGSHTSGNGSRTVGPFQHMSAQASRMAQIPSLLMEITSSDLLPVHGREENDSQAHVMCISSSLQDRPEPRTPGTKRV